VKNLTVIGNVSCSASSSYAGGVVGCNEDGRVSDCSHEGIVTASSGGHNTAGGVVGNNKGGTVERCAHRGAVSATGSSGDGQVGGVVEVNSGNGTVTDCRAEGDISATGGRENYVGGVVGNFIGGTVSGSSHSGKVSASGGSEKNYAGGVVGENSGGNPTAVKNCCHSGGAVTAAATGSADRTNAYAGGIAGNNSTGCNVQYGYHNGGAVTATATDSSKAHAGGIAGQSNGSINECGYNEDAGDLDIGNGTYSDGQLTPEQFKTQDSFTYWNFTNVWVMGADAPLLRALSVVVTFNANGGTGTMADQYVYRGVAAALRANEFTAPAEKHFAGWSTTAGGSAAYVDKASVTLAGGLTLYAVWQVSAAPQPAQEPVQEQREPFSQEFQSPLTFDGGKLVISPAKAGIRDTVTLTVIPDAGNELKNLTVTQKGVGAVKTVDHGSGVYTFTMPGGNVAFGAVFGEPEAQAPQTPPQTPPAKPNAVLSPQKITVNGVEVTVEAYNISGSNFFGLRELAAYLGYAVDYDEATNTAIITTP